MCIQINQKITNLCHTFELSPFLYNKLVWSKYRIKNLVLIKAKERAYDTFNNGNILLIIAHSFKQLLPNFHKALGNAGKCALALSLTIALLLIITGYRSAGYIVIWAPPYFLIH